MAAIHYDDLLQWLQQQGGTLACWTESLSDQIERGLSPERWGDLPLWQAALDALPTLSPTATDFADRVCIGTADDCSDADRQALRDNLMVLHPWRKGPVDLFGLSIDTEWRSDWKWDRLKDALDPLAGRQVLDVGCGNGYHCLRMFGAGAGRVIGIDPSAKFVCQFQALKRYCPAIPVDVLPLGIEQLPPDLKAFDTVFSMGVLYHRRDPGEHLRELAGCLRPGGQLVLETLVVEESQGPELAPPGRYARMRNVWSVPAPSLIISWLEACGFRQPQVVDVTATTTDEQRRTAWMHFHSLADFLDPRDPSKTIEGHPAPMRATFIAWL